MLRSADGIFARGIIERIVFELKPSDWANYGVTNASAGFEELGDRFRGWRCTWACAGVTVNWQREAQSFAAKERQRASHHPWIFGGPKCRPPWYVNAPSYDIYCVRADVDLLPAARARVWREKAEW